MMDALDTQSEGRDVGEDSPWDRRGGDCDSGPAPGGQCISELILSQSRKVTLGGGQHGAETFRESSCV